MKRIIDTMILGHEGYRFRTNCLGKQILQIGDICQDWDTNTGRSEGPRYTRWRDADGREASRLAVVETKPTDTTTGP